MDTKAEPDVRVWHTIQDHFIWFFKHRLIAICRWPAQPHPPSSRNVMARYLGRMRAGPGNCSERTHIANKFLTGSHNVVLVFSKKNKSFRVLRKVDNDTTDHIDYGVFATGKGDIGDSLLFIKGQLFPIEHRLVQHAKKIISRLLFGPGKLFSGIVLKSATFRQCMHTPLHPLVCF